MLVPTRYSSGGDRRTIRASLNCVQSHATVILVPVGKGNRSSTSMR